MPAFRDLGFAAFLAVLFAWVQPAGAGPLSESLVLVAKPELRHPIYGRAVLTVTPFGVDRHFGFIVNRPTRYRLADLFPRHAPSQNVVDPLFAGGPFDPLVLFALVARPDSPGEGSIRVMPGLYVAVNGRTVDRIIEANPDDARYLTGWVVWRAGELRYEIALGAWYVLDADPALALRDPKGLWEELVARSQRAGNLRATGY